eukprot:485427-Hanusia_phi.AAC.1
MKDEDIALELEQVETLFGVKVIAKDVQKVLSVTSQLLEDDLDPSNNAGPRRKKAVILLSANRSQTIGVLLSHLKIPHDDFRKAIMSLDTRTLQLMRLLPTDQEVAALQSYTGPKEDLGVAERFLFELLCIPRLKPRLQCFVFILEFNARLHDLSENVEVFSYAVHDIKRCTSLIKVLEIVLALGNYMNGQGPKGGAYGFKLEVDYIHRKFPEYISFPQELSNVEIGAKVSENIVDEISKFKKEIKFIYEEMNKPYYKSNAKTDPCGAKLEQFYHTAYRDMEVLEQNKKEALAMYKELSKMYGEEELKPDEFMTYIHQFAQSFKEAHNENVRKKEEEERVRARREQFLKQMQENERLAEQRRQQKQLSGKSQQPSKDKVLWVHAYIVVAQAIAQIPERPRQIKNEASAKPENSQKPPLRPNNGANDAAQITDMINQMPKSGKFVIKKNNTAEGQNLLRDHLGQVISCCPCTIPHAPTEQEGDRSLFWGGSGCLR